MFVSLKPAVCQGCVALRAHSNQLIGVRFGSTHYDVLGVPRKATKKQIREAYLEQSKKLHPDQNQNDPTSHDRFVKIGEAYNVLSSPSSRLSYDNSLDPPTARPFRYTSSHAHSATRSGHARTRPPPFRDPFTHSGPDWNSDFYGQGHGYSREEFEYFRRNQRRHHKKQKRESEDRSHSKHDEDGDLSGIFPIVVGMLACLLSGVTGLMAIAGPKSQRKEARAEEDAARTVLMFKRRRQATQSVVRRLDQVKTRNKIRALKRNRNFVWHGSDNKEQLQNECLYMFV